MEYELVMYSRTRACPFVRTAKRVLDREGIAYREIHIDRDPEAEARVVNWTGYRSVPTIILARPGEDLPYEEPEALAEGTSPRGVDRGVMITEPGETTLEAWLQKHGLLEG